MLDFFNQKKKILATQRTLEMSKTDEKYFARARKTGKVGMKEIAEEIQRITYIWAHDD